MRHRETVTGAFDTQLVCEMWSRGKPTSPYGLAFSATSDVGERTVKSIDDVEVPRFQRLVKCGEFLPLNPVDIRTTVEKRTPGVITFVKEGLEAGSWFNMSYYAPGDRWYFSGDWKVKLPEIDDGKLSYVSNASIADAKAAVWDALTTLGEARETVSLLRGAFNRFFDFASWVAKRVPRKVAVRDRAEFFAQLWLEYRYGWMPLVYDIQNIKDALASKVQKGEIVRGRSRQTEEFNDRDVTTTVGGEATIIVTQTLKGSRDYRGKAYARVTDAERAVMGLDPIITGYELTRFSFIVDWFIDINSWLQAWTPFSGAELLGCCNSIKESYTLEEHYDMVWGLIDPDPSHFRTSGDLSCSTKLTVERYTRFPSGISLPSWNPRLNKARIADLASLIFMGRSRVMQSLRL